MKSNGRVTTRVRQPGPTELRADSVLSFEARRGQELLGTRGRLWVTQDGDPRDVFVGRGERFVFDRNGVVVIHALHEAGAFVLSAGFAARTRAGWFASIVAALRTRLVDLANGAADRPRRAPTAPRTTRERLAQSGT